LGSSCELRGIGVSGRGGVPPKGKAEIEIERKKAGESESQGVRCVLNPILKSYLICIVHCGGGTGGSWSER